MTYSSNCCRWESERILKWRKQECVALKRSLLPLKQTQRPLSVKFKTDPPDQKDQACVISRQLVSVNGVMNRYMSGWSMESTHCKRWAWGDTLSGRLPRFVLAWHSGGHGWAKWGRRNTYSQFPRIRGRSSLRRSQRERNTRCYEHKTLLLYSDFEKDNTSRRSLSFVYYP